MLTIETPADSGTWVINKQGAINKYGGRLDGGPMRFEYDPLREWLGSRSGERLFSMLRGELSEAVGAPRVHVVVRGNRERLSYGKYKPCRRRRQTGTSRGDKNLQFPVEL